MIILSLFDGISCGRLALERAEIPVSLYLASEIDKHAIKISQKNYPDIIQLGDVRNIRKMIESGIIGHVDLLIGGSPCQGFSYSGKGLAFDDPRSQLFFEYVEILKLLREKNPGVKFLLENVKMKKQYLDIITMFLGVEPVCINSSLVSAQNRVRYYWCNWKVEQPADKEIFLKDIIQWDIQIPASEKWHKWFYENSDFQLRKKYCAIVNDEFKAITMTARQYSSWNGNIIRIGSMRGRRTDSEGIRQDNNKSILPVQYIEFRNDEKSNCLSTVQKDNIIVPFNLKKRIKVKNFCYRWLTPIECERLQTIPDNYTLGISNIQRYRSIGNGWTVDVIAHILRGIQHV